MSFKWRTCTKCGGDLSPQVFVRWTAALAEKQNTTSSRNVAYPARTETNYMNRTSNIGVNRTGWSCSFTTVLLRPTETKLHSPQRISLNIRNMPYVEVQTAPHTKNTGSITKLRHCGTSWNVAGSILDGVTGIFHWHNPSGRTMALGLTQPLTEMSTRNISWGVMAAGA